MQKLDNRSAYADVIERVLYNGVLSALSLDGRSFFYENPLEITCLEHFSSIFGPLRFPALSRAQSFECSCCPPNINRLLPVLGEYILCAGWRRHIYKSICFQYSESGRNMPQAGNQLSHRRENFRAGLGRGRFENPYSVLVRKNLP